MATGTTQTATFTLSAAQKIADVVKEVNGIPNDNTGSRSIRRSYNERGFWGKLTSYCSDTETFSFTEQVRTRAGWIDRDGGRTGTCSALNSLDASTPVNAVVWLRMDFPQPDDDGDSGSGSDSSEDDGPVYTFQYGGIPSGMYEGQLYGDITTSQTGFFFPSATPMVYGG